MRYGQSRYSDIANVVLPLKTTFPRAYPDAVTVRNYFSTQVTIMSKNEAAEATDGGDLAKSLHALKLDQKDQRDKHVTRSTDRRHNAEAHSNIRNKKQPSDDGKANERSNDSSIGSNHPWRPSTQRQAPQPRPTVTTRSQTQAARSWRSDKGKISSHKHFVLPRPRPTIAYSLQALRRPQAIDTPRDLLVILDLNGTLVHRVSRKQNASFTKRPFCKEFIQYLAAEHKIMIWSSSREHNVERLCKSIFEEVGIDPPVHRWHRGHFRLSQRHFDMNVQLYKQLTWVWSDASISEGLRSATGAAFDQSNTILIDDSGEKALSEPYNLIRVDEYDGTDQESDVLGKVVEYLERARRVNDVSCFLRDSPFAFKSTDAPYAWPSLPSKGDEPGSGAAV